ncbi:MAG TPA: prolyl oligopeptidase family serine peptidase [Trebonia sp.]|nr:prolyl oligopeptidase family serine peptidase [Trebonia sp.]
MTSVPTASQRDLRGTPLWAEIEQFYRDAGAGQSGSVSSVADPVASPAGPLIAFTGSGTDSLEQSPWSRVYLLDRETGHVREVPSGGRNAYRPAWSASGRWLAFLTDGADGAALCYLDVAADEVTQSSASPRYGIDGFTWSSSADRVLAWGGERRPELGTVPRHPGAPWLPAVRATFASAPQDVFTEVPGAAADDSARPDGLRIWEAAWVGSRAYLALASDHAEPANWYEARLVLVETATGAHEELHRPELQAGRLTASPDGQTAAWLEGLASDRGMIAGAVVTLDLATRKLRRLEPGDWEITDLRFRDNRVVSYLGLRGSRTVAGNLDSATLRLEEAWNSAGTCGMPLPSGAPAPDGSLLVAYEDWHTEPVLRAVGGPLPETDLVPSPSTAGARWLRGRKGTLAETEWVSEDGLAVSGLLITPPDGEPPYPLVVNVHGGPVWAWRNNWEIVGHTPVSLVVSRGFAVLNPNGRGSIGRGPGFVNAIRHAMGGADIGDYTSGARAMVDRGVADPARLSVVGHSYGGFMACCLAAADGLFSAAVAISPATDWTSQHHISGIPGFDELFVGRHARGGPVELAPRVTTPTLVIGCEDDDCCPVGQAIEFYRAVAEAGGAEAALAVYPAERHGIRNWPALLDQSVRIVGWLERYAK